MPLLRRRPAIAARVGDAPSPTTTIGIAAERERYWETPHAVAPGDRVAQADIYGMFNLKARVREFLTIVEHWPRFRERRVRLTRGILLDGAPGQGKTMVTRWMLSDVAARCYDVRDYPTDERFSVRDVRSLWAGARAEAERSGGPVMLVWEEIGGALKDAALSEAIKTEMDGLRGQSSPVFLVATTNSLEGVDPALLRPGRFGIQAHCQMIPKTEQRRLFADRLSAAGLPEVPEAYLKNLLAGGLSAAAIVEMIERVEVRAAILHADGITEGTIARLLVEQRFPIPDDRDEYEAERTIAWHEFGHGLACYALDLNAVLINICDLGKIAGSVWFAEEKLSTYLDGFCSIVVAAAGKAMERIIFGEENVTLHSAGGDYHLIAEEFMHLFVAGGGADGSQFDWHAMRQAMSANASERHTAIDEQAARLTAIVAGLAYQLIAEADADLKARGTSLQEACLPFVQRLIQERIVLGADLYGTIKETLTLPPGFFRGKARDAWARFERQMHIPGGK